MIEKTEYRKEPVLQLLILATIVLVGHFCIPMFRFTNKALNFSIAWAYLLVPFIAISSVRRLPKPFKSGAGVLLVPVLLFTSISLLMSFLDAVAPGLKRVDSLQTIQQGACTVELCKTVHGGAVGPHGIYLEQRRLIVPGLYLVKTIDYYSSSYDATLSVEASYEVRVHAKGNYYDPHFEIDKVYSLKPWVYF